MKFIYYGHSAFGLEADSQSVLIDPFITGNPLATVSADSLTPNTILLTHAHNDHVGDTVEIARRNSATVIANPELAGWLGSQGVEGVVAGNFGGTIGFEGGSAKFVPAWHTSTYTTADGLVAPGVPAGFVVRFGGRTIYFAGDTGLFLDMQLIADEDLDIAVLPIGDTFTMGPKDAARAAKLLRAPIVIPCHYNTFPPIVQDAEAFKQDVESQTAFSVQILAPGEDISL